MDSSYLLRLGLEIKTGTHERYVLSRGYSAGSMQRLPAAVSASSSTNHTNGLNSRPAVSSSSKPSTTTPANTASDSSFGKDLLGKGFERKAVVRGNHPPWLVPNAGHDAKLQVVNSLTGEKEAFRPMNDKKVIWYTCGPTVYDVAHMGHARAYLTFDILRRIMMNYLGYEVKYQINITDIDDKIILRARQNKLFDDFRTEASGGMAATELQKLVQAALQRKAEKLKDKTPKVPAADAPSREKDEYQTLLQEHGLKLAQHAELEKKVSKALEVGQLEEILSSAREPLMEKLDKEKGHTVTEQSIFDAHGRRFEKEYFEDMDSLGILRPDVVTRITEYMDGRVQKFIEKLEEMGVAYESGGSVYFDIASFERQGFKYRKLVPAMCTTAKEMEEGEGALASDEAEKRSPNDFALWKKSKPGEPAWESKWGPGRPGWHIECSVMATDINGEYLDIHAGGEDLKFPHHDNEMAQSEAYLKRSQWVNYFWHAGHLHIEGLKMSKSLKNFITIRQALEMHSARQLRLMFLMQAWDKGMNYSDQAIDMARAEERKLKHFLGALDFWRRKVPEGGKQYGEKEAKLEASVQACKASIHTSILDNFGTPKVIEAISKLVSECKNYMEGLPEVSLTPLDTAAALVSDTLRVLGVEGLQPSRDEATTAWTKALDAFADLRQEVRELLRQKADLNLVAAAAEKVQLVSKEARGIKLAEVADALDAFADDLKEMVSRKASAAEFLKRCDAVRDVDFVKLGVRLEDRNNDGYLWMFDDRRSLEAEQREKEEKDREAARQKIRNKLDQKQKEVKAAEKAAVEPKNFFRTGANSGLYSDFDEEGVPTKLASGEEVSAKKRKDLSKDLSKQQKDFEKLQKQAGPDGVDAYLDKMRREAAELEAQIS